jgi:hypothetical protein
MSNQIKNINEGGEEILRKICKHIKIVIGE